MSQAKQWSNERPSRDTRNIHDISENFHKIKKHTTADDMANLVEQFFKDDFINVLLGLNAIDVATSHAESFGKWQTELLSSSEKKLSELIHVLTDIILSGQIIDAEDVSEIPIELLEIAREYLKMPNLEAIYLFHKKKKGDFWFILSSDERSIRLDYIDKFKSLQEKFNSFKLDFMIIEKSRLSIDDMPHYSAKFSKFKGDIENE